MHPTLVGTSWLEIAGVGFALALILSPLLLPLLSAAAQRFVTEGESDEEATPAGELEPLIVYGAVGAAFGLLLPAVHGTAPLAGLGPGALGGAVALALTMLLRWAQTRAEDSNRAARTLE